MQIIEKSFPSPFKDVKYNLSSYFRRGNEYILFLHGIQSNKELFKQIINQDFLYNYGIIAPTFPYQ